MNRKRTLAAIAAAACIIIVLCAVLRARSRTHEMEVLNEAGEAVIHATVEINGGKFDIQNLGVGEIRRLKYKAEEDNHYTVMVEFRYERMMGPESGHFSGRVSGSNQLVIKRDQIVLESGR